MQNTLMKIDPAFGTERPYPSHAAQWRDWHGRQAWLFNPWSGQRRHPSDIGSDQFGLLIVPVPEREQVFAGRLDECSGEQLIQMRTVPPNV